MAKILLVDDDPQALASMRKILEYSHHEVVTASDGQAALDEIRPQASGAGNKFELVITDVRMPRLGGLEFLRALSLCGEQTPVILMTAFGKVEDAVWAMKLGAVDFLTKPFKRQTLLSAVESVLKRSKVNNVSPSPEKSGEKTVSSQGSLDSLIGRSAPMRELRETIRRVAPTDATVLLTGESGTGKELVARCIHRESARVAKRFIGLNCAAVPEQLIESELFGFEKGAFTGATGVKDGLFEAANGGTLLLDEIGDMPLALQASLLRTLQEGEVRRLGATLARKVDVRVIAATHRELRDCVRAGNFRQDLLFRLEVISIRVPALRERMEDLPELAAHFLETSAKRHRKELKGIASDAMQCLLGHLWPGNVRELSNVIERAVVFATQESICASDLPPHLVNMDADQVKARSPSGTIEVPLGASLKEVEDLLIRKTLEATSGDKNMTAKLLGINSRTIYRKLDKRS